MLTHFYIAGRREEIIRTFAMAGLMVIPVAEDMLTFDGKHYVVVDRQFNFDDNTAWIALERFGE